ncbi:unnamed protein product [Orchesella dallaii]|uniref:Uncharacterized protein n=1 Tax=Orchesella dallaii TaxID=48710 RepID=A0ABP1PL15_9HEXA
MDSFSKLCKKIGWLLFASAILFYDGHEFHEKFAVLKLTSNRSSWPLPKLFVSIIISLEVDIEEPTLQFWTTYLTSSEKPIESSEVLREVTGKWCSKIVESHLNFYLQQIQEYFRLLCNPNVVLGKSRDEFVDKTVTLLKLSLKAESSYIQQICEDRLRNAISKDETVQTFEPNLNKAFYSCISAVGSHELKQRTASGILMRSIVKIRG